MAEVITRALCKLRNLPGRLNRFNGEKYLLWDPRKEVETDTKPRETRPLSRRQRKKLGISS